MSQDARSTDLAQRLLRYSAVASLATAGALAVGPGAVVADPVVVQDPEPDIVLELPGSFDIDFDGGSPEFTLDVKTGTIALYNGLLRVPYTGIGIANTAASVSFIGQSTATLIQLLEPSAIEYGGPISDAAGNWKHPTDYCVLTAQTSLRPGTFGQWRGLTGQHYLGVRYGSAPNTHYGWVELTVLDAGNEGGPTLTIHRWAHDTTAGAGITAGEGIPSAVEISALQAASGLRAVSAAAFAALAGVFSWLRRKIARA